MKSVAILGCGPAGMLAAHAAERVGWEPYIYSHKVKSRIPGSQYLHQPIPGATQQYPENTVQYMRMGNEQDYAMKVYGDPSRPTGWEHYDKKYPSWNVPKMYDLLWNRFENRVNDCELGDFERVREIALGHDIVITTLPAQVLCHKQQEHKFDGVPYWIKELELNAIDVHRDVVVYNGLPFDRWYRWSILGGRHSIESCDPIFSDGEGVTAGTKAVWTTCDCWPTFIRAGRWAEWRHGVLLHHCFIKCEYELGSRK